MERLNPQLGAGTLIGDWTRLLRYGRGIDNARLLTELGFTPRYDAAGAVADLAAEAAGRRVGPTLHPGALAAGAARLAGIR
jgi:hypothetical protein